MRLSVDDQMSCPKCYLVSVELQVHTVRVTDTNPEAITLAKYFLD